MEKTEDILKKIYLFSHFTDEELSRIASRVEKNDLPMGHILFSEGSEATSLFVVKSGTLKVTTNTKEGDDVALTTLASGEHLGELPFLDGEKRSANVEALENTQLLELSYKDLSEILAANRDMELKIYKALGFFLVRRLRVLTMDITHAREIRKRFT